MSNYSEYLEFTREIAFKSGKVLNNYFGNITSVNKKTTSIDLVTEADLNSEKLLIENIQKKYPTHSIITEESDLKEKESEFRWIIDPLDGTTNFVHNLPIFAISIGLQHKQETVLGVVYNPAANKMFHASINNGAYLNDKLIKVSSSNTLSNSLIATGFPYIHDLKWELSFDIFKDIYSKTRGIRRLGSAALDLCFVAMGRFEGFYEFNLKPWDICAGTIIAHEAGAKVTDWNNNKLPFSGKRILGTNGKVHKEMISILNSKKYNIFYT